MCSPKRKNPVPLPSLRSETAGACKRHGKRLKNKKAPLTAAGGSNPWSHRSLGPPSSGSKIKSSRSSQVSVQSGILSRSFRKTTGQYMLSPGKIQSKNLAGINFSENQKTGNPTHNNCTSKHFMNNFEKAHRGRCGYHPLRIFTKRSFVQLSWNPTDFSLTELRKAGKI